MGVCAEEVRLLVVFLERTDEVRLEKVPGRPSSYGNDAVTDIPFRVTADDLIAETADGPERVVRLICRLDGNVNRLFFDLVEFLFVRFL